ncbi:MAG: T9SS type A sorting domain-containing protein [Muribaculaceae bacterium]
MGSIKRLFVFLLSLLSITATGMAVNMAISYNGMEGETYDLKAIKNLTFDNGFMNIAFFDDEGAVRKDLSTIKSIKFPAVITGVESVGMRPMAQSVAVAGGELKIMGYDTESPQPAAIYNVGGVSLFTCNSLTESAIDVASLPKGMYILKLGNQTFKFVK